MEEEKLANINVREMALKWTTKAEVKLCSKPFEFDKSQDSSWNALVVYANSQCILAGSKPQKNFFVMVMLLYKVLTTTGEVYPPSVDQIKADFIMDLLWGDKLVSRQSYSKVHRVKYVKIIEVPHIEGLRIPEILEFASKHWRIDKYMPDNDSEKYPSRKWIWNVGKWLISYSIKSTLLFMTNLKRSSIKR